MAPALLLPGTVLARWQHTSQGPGTTTVLPDGCRDLVLRLDTATGQADGMVTPLDTQARRVNTLRPTQWIGFRLRPGVQVEERALLAAARAARHSGGWDEGRVLCALEDHVVLHARAAEALEALQACASVDDAARALGISPRSLERMLAEATGQPPRYWRALARMRRAACALSGGAPLVAIAADHGYADQSHFSRECLRWLGRTPHTLRHSPDLLATVAQPGYGA